MPLATARYQESKKKHRVKPSPAGGFWDAHPQANEPNAKATLKFKPCIQWVQRESTLPQHATTEICRTVFRDQQLMRRFRYMQAQYASARSYRSAEVALRTGFLKGSQMKLSSPSHVMVSSLNITAMMMLTISVLVLRSKFHCTSPTNGAKNPLEISYIIYSNRLIYHKYHIFGAAIVLSISYIIITNIIKS